MCSFCWEFYLDRGSPKRPSRTLLKNLGALDQSNAITLRDDRDRTTSHLCFLPSVWICIGNELFGHNELSVLHQSHIKTTPPKTFFPPKLVASCLRCCNIDSRDHL